MAFTLLELIVVVVVLAILAGYVTTKFSTSSTYKVDTAAEQIIAAGQLTQQLTMNDSLRAFSLSIQSDRIDLLVDAASIDLGEFPIIFDSSITISPTTSITFDGVGQTAATSITVTSTESRSVCFEASGLIHLC